MGCNRSKDEYDEAEELIGNIETKIGFSNVKCTDCDIIFHRYSISFRLNNTQFLAACKDLKLNMTSYGLAANPLTVLFKSFQSNEGFFDTRRLSALGVLLGKGSAKEKAKVIFKNYDTEISNTLDINEMRVLIDDLLEIALIIIPNYALSIINDEEEKTEVNKYNRKLSSVFNTFYKFYEILLIKDQETDITLDQFVELFNYEEISAMASASKLRKLGIQEHSKVIAPIRLVTTYILEGKNKK